MPETVGPHSVSMVSRSLSGDLERIMDGVRMGAGEDGMYDTYSIYICVCIMCNYSYVLFQIYTSYIQYLYIYIFIDTLL